MIKTREDISNEGSLLFYYWNSTEDHHALTAYYLLCNLGH